MGANSSTEEYSTEKDENVQFSSARRSETKVTTDFQVENKANENSSKLKLTRLTLPKHISHIKTGNTLATNKELLILQDGATTIDFRLPPEFKAKKVPWKFGLIRDIVWSENLQTFLLLTKNMFYSLDPKNFFVPQGPNSTSIGDAMIDTYAQIKPHQSTAAFWRCTTFDDNVLIIHAGFGTVMDHYKISRKSCRFVKRWTSPSTCAVYEGIWCIRHHPETRQIGCAVLDARTNYWRLEVRDRETFLCIWKINLPFECGDCEVSPLINGQWLATNSFNVRLIQIAQERLESAVEYERELKNALVMDENHLVLRTKSTVEVHRLDQIK